ncbi:MAG: ATP synthase F1 subunit gamma [Clostridiales bacterium]|nr:ATP synthase F1 subunit gamma [Clostridiales bacterium]MCC8065648.1 ATP synthase F1 subunit gamma [Clostridiales bacterium]
MAANMKAVKLRIKSVESTMQITKAMELVASSKLRRAKERSDQCRPYFRELHQTLVDIAEGNTDFSSVYAKPSANERCCYVVIAGDRGLAGGYNSNIFKKLEAAAQSADSTETTAPESNYVVLPIGKKAVEYFQRRHVEILTEDFVTVADISVADCFEIARLLCRQYREGRFGHIELCYTEFVSMLSQRPEIYPMLPLTDLERPMETGADAEPKDGASQGMDSVGERKKSVRDLILYEPDSSEVFDAIVPEYLGGFIYGGVCDALASELAARRNAMEAATSNAEEMIEKLNLSYNRARQSSITTEITEIVAGAEGVG